MSLKIGGSASRTKTKSTSNTTGTTTPIVPEWGSSLTQGIAGQVSRFVGQDPGQYVAPQQALQGQAAAGAATLGGSARRATAPGVPSGIGEANWLSPYMTANTPFASGGKAHNYTAPYENRYIDEVVNTSAADLDAQAGQVRAQQALDLAGAGAFGGSGAALTQSMTEGELARARASTLSGLRSRAFEQALAAAAGDADRATQARIGNAQTALQDSAQKVGFGLQAQNQMLAADANQRDNIAAQAQLGAMLRDVDQQQRQAPITNTQQIVAMLNGLPLGLFTGQQQNQTQTGTETKTQIGANFDVGPKG